MALSRKMMTTIRWNLSFSMGLHFRTIVLVITHVLAPVSGVLVHNTESVLVILNSALLLQWKKHEALLNEKCPTAQPRGIFMCIS